MSLPRPVVLIGLVCLAVGALGTLGAAFANARENGETFARSIGRSATTIHTRSTCATTKGLSRKVRQGPAVRPRAGARESALGLPADHRRAEWPRHHRL